MIMFVEVMPGKRKDFSISQERLWPNEVFTGPEKSHNHRSMIAFNL
jgi:hypothetical protein